MLFVNNQVSLCPVEEIKKGIKEIEDKHNVKIMSMFVNPENLVEWILTCTLPAPEILGIKRIVADSKVDPGFIQYSDKE